MEIDLLPWKSVEVFPFTSTIYFHLTSVLPPTSISFYIHFHRFPVTSIYVRITSASIDFHELPYLLPSTFIEFYRLSHGLPSISICFHRLPPIFIASTHRLSSIFPWLPRTSRSSWTHFDWLPHSPASYSVDGSIWSLVCCFHGSWSYFHRSRPTFRISWV